MKEEKSIKFISLKLSFLQLKIGYMLTYTLFSRLLIRFTLLTHFFSENCNVVV